MRILLWHVHGGWTDAFVTGDQFATFLTDQDKAVADILTGLGLA